MFIVGWFSAALLDLFPALEPVMRFLGAGYILYLAWGILRASYTFTEKEEHPLGFVHGLMLNILNPKLVVYAFTLFSAFLSSTTKSITSLMIVCFLLAATSFCATTVWSFFGTAIKRYLHKPRWKTFVHVFLSIMLVYTAANLIGII
jgi:cysteine/O-acetylserine efflux protein